MVKYDVDDDPSVRVFLFTEIAVLDRPCEVLVVALHVVIRLSGYYDVLHDPDHGVISFSYRNRSGVYRHSDNFSRC